jgi:hypothetical protein
MAIKQLELTHQLDADNPIEHDLRVVNGRMRFFEGKDTIAQKVKIRLQLFQGEWFLDQRIGFPYWQKVFVKNPDLRSLRALYKQAILESPGIASVDNLDLELTDRALNLEFDATTDEGESISLGPFVVGV